MYSDIKRPDNTYTVENIIAVKSELANKQSTNIMALFHPNLYIPSMNYQELAFLINGLCMFLFRIQRRSLIQFEQLFQYECLFSFLDHYFIQQNQIHDFPLLCSIIRHMNFVKYQTEAISNSLLQQFSNKMAMNENLLNPSNVILILSFFGKNVDFFSKISEYILGNSKMFSEAQSLELLLNLIKLQVYDKTLLTKLLSNLAVERISNLGQKHNETPKEHKTLWKILTFLFEIDKNAHKINLPDLKIFENIKISSLLSTLRMNLKTHERQDACDFDVSEVFEMNKCTTRN